MKITLGATIAFSLFATAAMSAADHSPSHRRAGIRPAAPPPYMERFQACTDEEAAAYADTFAQRACYSNSFDQGFPNPRQPPTLKTRATCTGPLLPAQQAPLRDAYALAPL